MKLFLPHTLLAFVLAGFALQTQADIPTINLNGALQGGDHSYDISSANLSLNGDCFPSPWVESDSWYADNYDPITYISWRGDAGESYSLSGSGTLGGFSILAGSDAPESGKTTTFHIGSGIRMHSGNIEAAAGSIVYFAGSVDSSKDADTTFTALPGGILNLEQAQLDSSYVYLDFFGGGTITRSNFRVDNNRGVGINTADTYTSTFNGNLTLAEGGFVEFFNSNHEGEANAPVYGKLHVNGTLTIENSTDIFFLFHGTYLYPDGTYPGDENWGPDCGATVRTDFPAAGSVLFTAMDLQGANYLNQIQLLGEEGGEWYWDKKYEQWDFIPDSTADLTDTIHLGYTFSEGVYEIKVYAGATIKPDNNSGNNSGNTPDLLPPVTSGSISGTLSNEPGRNVELSGSNTVDATGVTGGLSNEFVKGNGGTLITSANQQMLLRGHATPGYNIVGTGGNPAADLIVGQEGGQLGDAYIILAGQRYESNVIKVLSGQLETRSGTTLGTADSLITIGSDSATGNKDTASVNNFGTVAGNVLVKKLASMDNRGSVMGDIILDPGAEFANNGTVNGTTTVMNGASLQGSGSYKGVHLLSGGRMHVGNSPGYSRVGHLNLDGGSTLSFTVDGTTAATATNTGDGTHSQLRVTDRLTLNGTVNAEVEVTMGILASAGTPFTLTLLDASGATVVNNTGEALPVTVTITRGEEWLEEGYSFAWDATTNSFTLTGEANAMATAMLGSGGTTIANTLWSSTSAVRSFAHAASSQLGAPTGADATTVWASGLGDFVSIDGFTSSASGYAVGVDRRFGESLRLGLSFGQLFGDFSSDDKLAEVEQESTMAGLYGEYVHKLGADSSLRLTAYAAYGSVDNEADTFLPAPSLQPGSASWSDDVFAAGLRAEWAWQVTEETTVAPFIGLEFLRGEQEDFSEKFADATREYSDGSMQALSLPVGITFRANVPLGDVSRMLPELTLAYVGDVSRRDPRVNSRVYSANFRHEGTKTGRSAFMIHAGAHWLFTESWSAGAFFNVESRSKDTSTEASFSIRYSF